MRIHNNGHHQNSRVHADSFRLASLSAVAIALVVTTSAFAESAPIQFNRDIRPILSDKCFHCHGPDSASRQGDLRLDQKVAASSVIKSGDVAASELIARITHKDTEQRMPPSDSGRTLSRGEIELLTRWVEQGAAWQEHWSFVPPARPAVPEVKQKAWIQNSIDRFVLARLEAIGMQPSPRATKTALIRRVTFDLTGLPPTLPEIDAFLDDDSTEAFERVVDRLLESHHYGERMASDWLDAARYADSHGYSLDRRRVMWPWRDWVIHAYNENMPFDRFTVEQIAGDLLPNATIAQQVATGFNRNHPIQSEGGVINEEYRVETVVDRVETTSAVFLGMTMGCGRCHDHKYEPISQREFYQFYAFFNNVPETAHVGNRDNDADKPFLAAPSVLQNVQIKQLETQIAAAEKALQAVESGPPPKPVERVWIDDTLPAGAVPFGNGSGPQEFRFVSGEGHPVLAGKKSSQRTSNGLGQHGFQNAVPLTVSTGTKLFAHVFLDPKNPPQEIMLQWHGANGWEHRAYWGGNHIAWGADKTISRLPMGAMPETGKWIRLEVDATAVGFKTGSQINGWAFTQFGGSVHWDKAGIVTVVQPPAVAKLAALKAELQTIRTHKPTVMVMSELTPRRKTFVLTRGQYDQPSKVEVTPSIPAVLGKLPAKSKENAVANRLTLALWLASPENPLTARVAVNRYWQMYFGSGLVTTPEDFGTQGMRPSHPELLDWLATEFVRTGWDVKAMQKLIVMSATYQQSSRMTPAQLERDPKNKMLARGTRFRLPAEMIRDNALAISGLMVDRLGGPSVRPYQPPGLWDDVVYGNVPRFKQDHGDKLYRRSLYIYWKRSVPPPNLQMFDAPSREACVLQRSRTNTPLAALVLMNDPTYVEAAKKLAERSLVEAGKRERERLGFMFRLATSRQPDQKEVPLMQDVLDRARSHYDKNREDAKKLMQIGESSIGKDVDVVEAAAYTAIAIALLNLDETITRN
ncbi:MAG: hypothetical protein CMJ78_21105 [Planctomycetaceae bacterium]|nr:hypothetical protein [Planctomycetaceae bacterium]